MKRAKRLGEKSDRKKPGQSAKAPKSAKKSVGKMPARKAKTAARSTKEVAHDWTLAGRVAAAPKLSDAKAARKRVADWLGSTNSASAKAIASLFAVNRHLPVLIEGIGENSPFLWELITADAARLVRLLRSDPDTHFRELLSETSAATSRSGDEAEAMRLLRRMKAEGGLLIALCDIGEVWPIMRCTQALTELADTAVASAVRFLLNDAAKAGRLSLSSKSQPEKGSGYVVLAMGKMGAGELNYSSDIDLIVLYDRQAAPLAKNIEPAPFFVRLTQRLVKLLQERNGDGYVFRTDLRLRPDPASTAIAISTEAALSYYEGSGQNWERAAMIKARPCAGDLVAGERFLEAIAPFVWRKYLDFAAVADVQAMKQQIHAYRGHAEVAVEGHNIKLGRGGIREVEFFAQTQQLIAGGRNPTLRDRETLPTLDKLVEDRWIDAPTRDDMRDAYLFLRKVEHRLQMINDDQTQTLPDDPAAMERLSHFLGFATRDAFASELLAQLKKVQKRYGALFEATIKSDKAQLSFPPDSDDKRTLDRLVEMGFRAPLETSARVRQWLSGEYRSLRSEAARTQLGELLPQLLEHFAKTSSPDTALIPFDSFLSNLHNATRLLSLLRQNPELIDLIAMVISTAPRLADTLSRYPQVMDALVEPSFFGVLPDERELARRLETAIAQARYDEDLLDRIRMFGLEYMFLIGVRILTGTVTAAQAGEAFARLADTVIREVHRAVSENFAQQHGHLAKEQSAVVALGKLGGNEMTATSDLDLLLIYDFDETNPESDGRKPLHGSHYFARLTQRLINALTAQTNYGALYQVDMRLRPSGRSGPLATMISSFAAYQESDAWTWEHMALTRARVISASEGFAARVDKVIADTLGKARDPHLIAGDVVEMRGAIAKEKGDAAQWDLKYAAGGLIDIEFIVQYLSLVHGHQHPDLLDRSTARVLGKARALGVLSAEEADVLRPAVSLYQDLTQILRLCLPGPFDRKKADPGLLRLLARAGDVPDFAALEVTLAETQTKVRESFIRILGAAPEPVQLGN